MRYLKTLVACLSQPDIYPRLISRPLSFTFGYLFFWYGIFSLTAGLYLTLRFFSPLQATLMDAIDHLKNNYPSDLVLHLQDNQLQAIGSTQPIVFTLPDNPWFVYDLALILDTSQSVETLAQLNTYLAASSQAIAFNLPGLKQTLIIPYQQLALSGTLDTPAALNQLENAKQNLATLSPLTVIVGLSLGLFLAIFPGRSFYLVITSLILIALGTLNRTPYHFSQYTRLTLFALVAAEAVNLTVSLIYGSLLPYLFPIAFVGYTFIGILSLFKPPSTQVA